MKKILLLSIVYFILSCSSTSFIAEPSQINTGLDLRSGKWILNNIDCAESERVSMNDLAKQNFESLLPGRLFDVYSAKGAILPPKIDFFTSKEVLQKIKIGAPDYQYLINVSTKDIKNDIGGFSIKQGSYGYNDNNKNQGSCSVNVYDIKLGELIYERTVIGTDSRTKPSMFELEENKRNYKKDHPLDIVEFHTSTQSLIFKSFNKIIKDIKKKSLKVSEN